MLRIFARSAIAVLALVTSAFAASRDWQAVTCVPDESPREASFEVVQIVDDFESEPLRWDSIGGEQSAQFTLSRDASERHRGDAALRIDYQFLGKSDVETIQIQGKLDLSRPGLEFGFWVKTDGTSF
jgi:hypothetical protein